MIDVHCRHCGRLLLKATVFIGAIKCNRCYKIFEYKVLGNTKHYLNTIDLSQKPAIIPTEPLRGQAQNAPATQ